QQLLIEWNDTEWEWWPKDGVIIPLEGEEEFGTTDPIPLTVHELFENQVKKTPDSIAVVFEDEQITYRELNVRANRLANYLVELGVGPEQRVAICLERSIEMMVSIMAVIKTGAAYVPID